jgi:hypothetical protein
MEKENLIGSWKLLAASGTSTAGERDEATYGANPSGLLLYGADGRMSALISYGGRKPLSGRGLAEEEAQAFKTFFAYAGRYTVNGEQIIHHVEISSIQNFVGRDMPRTAKLEGDTLTLTTPPTPINGKVQTVELIWQRLPSGA